MSITSIPDLWPQNIRVSVLEPIAILRAQETALNKKTQGLLRAEVRTNEMKETGGGKPGRLIYTFDLIAPVLGSYSVTLLRVHSSLEGPYPVLVQSRVFNPSHKFGKIEVPTIGAPEIPKFATQTVATSIQPGPEYREAATQDEFITLVGHVLQSSWVRSLIESLIANSNAHVRNQGATPKNGDSSEASNSPA